MKKLNDIIGKIEKIDRSLEDEVQKRLDNLTKPKGSLGRLEDIAKQIVLITENKNPVMEKKVIFTMAGDHGVVEEGVSCFPQEVTIQMVHNFIKGGAGINVLARHIGAKVVVVDMGVKGNLEIKDSRFKDKKICHGTKNFTKGKAMTKKEAIMAIEAGIDAFEEEFTDGIDIVGTGDMGIGNTTPSSAITSVITGMPVEDTVGRGTGIDDKTFLRKMGVIKKAIAINEPDPDDPIDVLSKIGGFEIGGLAGVILAACSYKIPVVIDGFISGASALIAYKLCPRIKDYLFAGHCSFEKGHRVILNYIGLSPILDLNMRLGEGTGASLAMGVIEASCKILTQMATFDDARVSKKL